MRIEAPRSDDDPHLDGLRPDVVIVDLATAHAAGLCASLQEHPGLPLIGLDSNSSVIFVLSRG